MKKLVFTFISLVFSLGLYAQASGGQIKRNKQTTTNIKQTPRSQQGNTQQSKNVGIGSKQGDTYKVKNATVPEEELEKKYQNMSMISLEKYANQGDAMAQFYLGYKYAQIQDYRSAVVWYRKAAYNDLVRAQLWLAWCYYNGKGVDRDTHGAREWLKEAASKGSTDAKEYLRTWFK